jgi:2-polyprenyl-3-methyl-5-hydroxy-6-metoxy-1,4-benzoquinol methylase
MTEEIPPIAQAISKMILQIIKPKSIVDVGCANGVFLREFQAQGWVLSHNRLIL